MEKAWQIFIQILKKMQDNMVLFKQKSATVREND